MTGKIKKLSLLFSLFALSPLNSWAQSEEEGLEEIEAFRRRIEESLVSPAIYKGQDGGNIYGKKFFCEEEHTYLVDWSAEYDNVTSTIDTSTGVINVSLSLKNAHYDVGAFKKGRFTCFWRGGEGRVEAGSLKANVTMTPVKDRSNPDVAVNSFVLDGLDFKEVLFFDPINPIGFFPFVIPFFYSSNIPSWFDEFFENNVNYWGKVFLATEFKKRFDNLVTDKLGEALEKIRTEHLPHPEFPIDEVD